MFYYTECLKSLQNNHIAVLGGTYACHGVYSLRFAVVQTQMADPALVKKAATLKPGSRNQTQ